MLSEGAPPPALSAVSAGEDHGAVRRGERPIQPLLEPEHGCRRIAAHGADLAAEPVGERLGPRPVAVGHDQDLGTQIRHVTPGKAVSERDREDAVATLERLHPVDEAPHRLARGVEEGDHPAVGDGGDGSDLTARRTQREVDELAGAPERVGVRIFLVEDEEVGSLEHRLRQVAVRIELGADHHRRTHPGAHRAQQIALAVLAAFGDHRAVQAQEHDVDRERRLELGEHPTAQLPPGGGGREAGRGGEGLQAFDQREAFGARPLTRGDQGPGEEAGLLGVRSGLEPEIFAEARDAGRDRREAVGLGPDRRCEDAHRRLPLLSSRRG